MSRAQGRHPTCTWNGCPDKTYSWLPVCREHAEIIAEVMAPADSYETAKALLRGEANAALLNARRRREAEKARDLAASRGNQPGWIYYVLTDGKVKIGYSAQVTRRLRAYPPGSEVLAVHPGTPDLEKRIHQDFDAYRVAGREWFSPADEILTHCATIREQHGNPQRYAPKVRAPHDANRIVAGKRHH